MRILCSHRGRKLLLRSNRSSNRMALQRTTLAWGKTTPIVGIAYRLRYDREGSASARLGKLSHLRETHACITDSVCCYIACVARIHARGAILSDNGLWQLLPLPHRTTWLRKEQKVQTEVHYLTLILTSVPMLWLGEGGEEWSDL